MLFVVELVQVEVNEEARKKQEERMKLEVGVGRKDEWG